MACCITYAEVNRGVGDFELASDPMPMVVLEPVRKRDITITRHGTLTVTIAGRVLDHLADIVPDGLGKIPSITIEVRGREPETISLGAERDGRPTLVRPYPYRSTRFKKTVSFVAENGGNAIIVKTANNLAGNQGFDTVSILVGRTLLDTDFAALSAFLGSGEGVLTFNIVPPASFDAKATDRIRFYLGDRAPTDQDPEGLETAADDLVFDARDSEAAADVKVTGFKGLTDKVDTLDATLDLFMDGTSHVVVKATFTETGAVSGRFTFSLNAADLTYNLYLPERLSEGKLDTLVFHLGNRSPRRSDRLRETAPSSCLFEGKVPGLGDVTVRLGCRPNLALDKARAEVTRASVLIRTPRGAVEFDGALRETAPDSRRFFYLALARDPQGNLLSGGLERQNIPGPPEVIAVFDSMGFGGGSFTPWVVRATVPPGMPDLVAEVLGSRWELVRNPRDRRDRFLYFGYNGVPAVFVGLGRELPTAGPKPPNVKHAVGLIEARVMEAARSDR